MTDEMSVRERLLTALDRRQPDRVPCSFMIFRAVQERCRTEETYVRHQADLGLDPFVHLGHLPMAFHPDVTTSTVKEADPAGGPPRLRKVYRTPAGDLTAVVRQTDDWPHGDAVPLFDDYLIPRSDRFLVTGREDLPALQYLFGPFRDEDVAAYRERSRALRAFARARGLPTAAGWGRGGQAGVMGIEAATWLVGMDRLIYLAHDDPGAVGQLAALIADWNRRLLEIILADGPDLVIRRAWYETTEFWTPDQYGRFILPHLRAEADLVHQAGSRLGYIQTSAMMPLVPHLLAAGVDAIIGVDPVQGKGTHLADLKAATAGRIALWGGVSGSRTVEMADEAATAAAVRHAIDLLAPGGGFILSPVDNVRQDSPQAWANVRALVVTCHTDGNYARGEGRV